MAKVMRSPVRPICWAASRVCDVLGRAFAYAAAGATNRTEFKRGVAVQWDAFVSVSEGIEAGWWPPEAPVAHACVPPGARVMVVGCGTGRDLIPFVERGCVVSGLDPAPGAIARARQELVRRGLTADLTVGYVEDHVFEGTFDAFWFSWGTFSYIP